MRYNGYTKTQHIINVYNLVSVDIRIHMCYHHHNQRRKHIHHLQKFPCVRLWVFVCVCVVRTLTMRSALLTNFKHTVP